MTEELVGLEKADLYSITSAEDSVLDLIAGLSSISEHAEGTPTPQRQVMRIVSHLFVITELENWLSGYSAELKVMRDQFLTIEQQNNTLEVQRINHIGLNTTLKSLLTSLSLPTEKVVALTMPSLDTEEGRLASTDAAKVFLTIYCVGFEWIN